MRKGLEEGSGGTVLSQGVVMRRGNKEGVGEGRGKDAVFYIPNARAGDEKRGIGWYKNSSASRSRAFDLLFFLVPGIRIHLPPHNR